jgi:hypothetical protein
MYNLIEAQKEVIRNHNLYNWFENDTWLTGYTGNMNSKIMFLCPRQISLKRLNQVKNSVTKEELREDLQWNYSPGDHLLREALEKAGLLINGNQWKCCITNAIKEVASDTDKETEDFQIERWWPVLYHQIKEMQSPRLIITVGKTYNKVFDKFWKKMIGEFELDFQIENMKMYTYIADRHDRKSGLGPNDPSRREEYIETIRGIVCKHSM